MAAIISTDRNDMSDTSFVHLHLHSQYSLLDGAIKIKDLVTYAGAHGMPALAITDHGNMFAAVEFYLAAKAAGIKPIFGCEVYVATGSRFEKANARSSSDASHHLVLLAQNLDGYRNLCRLVSASYREGFYYKPRVDWELLQECNQGLIALTACLGGEIPTLIEQGKMDVAQRRSREMAQIFDQERFFLELQENHIPEQALVNRGLKDIAAELGLPLVATNDCHYLTREQAQAHEVLLCIQTGKNLDDPSRMRFPNDEFYVKTPAEMTALFANDPEAISNTVRIADRCDVDLDLKTYHFPQYEKPADKTLEEVLRDNERSGLEERWTEIRKVRSLTSTEEKR
jgi:DNA polymerase III subunit alpha